MTKIVRNSARPMRIWFEGVCTVPRAWRKMARTMTMRVKAVIIMRPAGSRVSAVMSSSTWTLSDQVCVPPLPCTVSAG